jgi:hypothetical protein
MTELLASDACPMLLRYTSTYADNHNRPVGYQRLTLHVATNRIGSLLLLVPQCLFVSFVA